MVGRKNTDARIRRALAAPGLKQFRKEVAVPQRPRQGTRLYRRIGRHAEAGRGGLLRQALAYFRADAGFAGI